MIDGTYVLDLDGDKGNKKATLSLKTSGSAVTASVNAPIIGKQTATGRVEGDSFTAQGTIKILLVGKIDYTVSGTVRGDVLTADIHSTKGNFSVNGTRA